MMKKLLKLVVPQSLRSTVRNAVDDTADFADRLRGGKDDLVPPRRMVRNIGGSFAGVGNAFLRHFIDLGGLQPRENVLDVGCGVGRMALPLTRYLADDGSYDGFDIDAREIAWCSEHITARYPNFRFKAANIYSKRYNPKGACTDAEFRFPYADGSFDFLFMTSVFTHILQPGMENYLSEVSRVLRGRGRCLITYFLLNDESMRLMQAGRSSLDFKHGRGTYRLVDENVPEEAVAYDEGFVGSAYRANGLTILEPVRYGNWCERTETFDHQDIVVAQKQ
jgi:SAM-dependent methyltransferase